MGQVTAVLQATPTSAAPVALPLRQRMVPAMPADALVSWLLTAAVTALAAFTRFTSLSVPKALVFDETYYVKDGLSIVKFGYERQANSNADEELLAGNTDIFSDAASFVIHPPLGKALIGAGQLLFGADPFGWRFAAALVGTLTVLLTIRAIRRLTRSTAIGVFAGLLLTLDGLHLTLSRTALLDGFLTFFVIAAFALLLLDRDQSRKRLADWAERRPGPLAAVGDAGPRLGVRWWRIGAGVALGLACGVKWSAVFFVLAFGLMTVLWDAGARKACGVRRPLAAMLRRDALPAFGGIVGIGTVAYLLTWTGWLASDGGWSRQWAAGRDSTFAFIPESIRSLWHFHSEILASARQITSEHPYSSDPIGWPFLARPVSMFYDGDQTSCGAETCSQAVTALGNPAVWWAGIAAIAIGLFWWIGRRDWRAGALLGGVAAGWLPWFLVGDRTIFSWYIVAAAPFVCGLIAMVLGWVLGPADAPGNRRVWGAAAVGAYLLLVAVLFAWFWPVWTAEVIPYEDWLRRMWLRSWI